VHVKLASEVRDEPGVDLLAATISGQLLVNRVSVAEKLRVFDVVIDLATTYSRRTGRWDVVGHWTPPAAADRLSLLESPEGLGVLDVAIGVLEGTAMADLCRQAPSQLLLLLEKLVSELRDNAAPAETLAAALKRKEEVLYALRRRGDAFTVSGERTALFASERNTSDDDVLLIDQTSRTLVLTLPPVPSRARRDLSEFDDRAGLPIDDVWLAELADRYELADRPQQAQECWERGLALARERKEPSAERIANRYVAWLTDRGHYETARRVTDHLGDAVAPETVAAVFIGEEQADEAVIDFVDRAFDDRTSTHALRKAAIDASRPALALKLAHRDLKSYGPRIARLGGADATTLHTSDAILCVHTLELARIFTMLDELEARHSGLQRRLSAEVELFKAGDFSGVTAYWLLALGMQEAAEAYARRRVSGAQSTEQRGAVLLKLANLLEHLKRGDEAIAVHDECCDVAATIELQREAERVKAQALVRLGAAGEAIPLLERQRARAQDQIERHDIDEALAQALAAIGRVDEAERLLVEALSRPERMIQLMAILVRADRGDDAVAQARQLSARGYGRRRSLELLAGVLAQVGRHSEALQNIGQLEDASHHPSQVAQAERLRRVVQSLGGERDPHEILMVRPGVRTVAELSHVAWAAEASGTAAPANVTAELQIAAAERGELQPPVRGLKLFELPALVRG
jgi:tetratricopeptide (TPR) repeat protein